MNGPLDGLKILDLTSLVMGPFATLMLADLGAEVIKVEAPEGDGLRRSTLGKSPNMASAFLNANRNKRSIVLDLKHPDGRAICLKLAANTDALLYNIRPKAMERLGLGYDNVAAVNPTILYVGAIGFSQRGPYADRPAYDDVMQGMIGMPWLYQVSSGSDPRFTPNVYADRTCALHITTALLAGAYHRARTGLGQKIDVPMFESLTYGLFAEHIGGETYIPAAFPMGNQRGLSKDRRPYKTSDGYICTLVYNDKQWRRFFELIGKGKEFDTDDRFNNQNGRTQNVKIVHAFLSETFLTRSTEDWLRSLAECDIPCGPMNSLEDILSDRHLNETRFFQEADHPSEGKIRIMAHPSEWSRTPPKYVRRMAPKLGEHSVEILKQLNYSRGEIDRLVKNGTVVAEESGSNQR